jgi:predicted Zn-dependent protease
MSIARDKYDRRILPRWHESKRLGEIYELVPARQSSPPVQHQSDSTLREAKDQFELTPTVGHAAALMSAAVVSASGKPDADLAAGFLMRHADELSPALRSVAEKVAGRVPVQSDDAQASEGQFVTEARHLLRLNPRNPLVWSDLARHHAAGGNKKKSHQAHASGTRSCTRSQMDDPCRRALLCSL